MSERFDNNLEHLVIATVNVMVWAFWGTVSGLRDFKDPRLDHVFLVGGAHQLYIPNLQYPDHLRAALPSMAFTLRYPRDVVPAVQTRPPQPLASMRDALVASPAVLAASTSASFCRSMSDHCRPSACRVASPSMRWTLAL